MKNMKKVLALILAMAATVTMAPFDSYASTTKTVTHAESKALCYPSLGITVSDSNGTIDWTKVAADGIEFAMICLGYTNGENGGRFSDEMADYNLEKAQAAGITVGGYFESQAVTVKEAKNEAAEAAMEMEDKGVPAGSVIAMHCSYQPKGESSNTGRVYEANLSAKEYLAIIESFCQKIDSEGYTPVVYANATMLETEFDGTTLEQEYKIWIDEEGTACTYTGDYDYWHFDTTGKVAGIEGKVDMDYQYTERTASAELTCDPVTLKLDAETCMAVDLSWTASENADGYVVERYNDTTLDYEIIDVLGSDKLSYKDQNVEYNTAYAYVVKAFCLDDDHPELIGYSTLSNELTVTTSNYIKGLTMPSKAVMKKAPTNTSTTIAKLTNNTVINILGSVKNATGTWYKIGKTLDGTMTIGYMRMAYVTEKSNAPAKVKLYVYPKTFSTIKLKWKTVSGADGYEVQRYNSSTSTWDTLTITDEGTTSFLDTDLTASKTYKYRIRASKVMGKYVIHSDYSSTVSGKTTAAVAGKTTAAVALRKTASTKAASLASLTSGRKVSVRGTYNSWYLVKVTIDGKAITGYVQQKYVKL